MKVYRGIESLPSRWPVTAVTIGNFDGVHRGHRNVIETLKRHAAELDSVPTVLTLDPHPQHVLHARRPEALATLERKIELLELAGIERVIVMKFTKRVSLIEPEDFIERILVGSLKARAIVVGPNFRFGHFARGDVVMLRAFGNKLGFGFQPVALRRLRGRSVSSTEIRHALAEGDLEWANLALGRPHRVPGKVVRGHGRGRAMGFPTVNLRPPPRFCIPRIGIYAGYFIAGATRMPAAISIGTNPTFSDGKLSVEAHVIDHEGDSLGPKGAIDLVRYLRDEETFSGPDALAKAIAKDVVDARRVLGRSRLPT